MKRLIAALLAACAFLAILPEPLAAQEMTWTQADTDRVTAEMTYVYVASGPQATCTQINTQMAMSYALISWGSSQGILTGTPNPLAGWAMGWAVVLGGLYGYFNCSQYMQ